MSTRKKKRVVAFVDMYDEIPADANYLFSKEHSFALDETEEQKAHRIISGNDTGGNKHSNIHTLLRG